MSDARPLQLAVQLYTLRHRLEQDVEGTLAALAGAGVRHVELAGLYGRSGQEMRAALDAAGLDAPSAHVALERFEREPGAVLEEVAALGMSTLVVPSVPRPATAAEADAAVARIAAAAEVATEAGLGFAYHNHDFEFTALDDGTDLWGRITAAGWDHELDAGWLYAAGRDPVGVLGELSGRSPLVHAKDMRRREQSGDERSEAVAWEDVPAGDGELDWAAIVAAARGAGTDWLVVELDNPSPEPVADVARSLETLQGALVA